MKYILVDQFKDLMRSALDEFGNRESSLVANNTTDDWWQEFSDWINEGNGLEDNNKEQKGNT